jgi:FixJ family two-component response regulator
VVLERMKANADLGFIPVIIITGRDATVRDRALQAGAVAFLQKPVDNDELLAAIRRALDQDAERG